MINQSDHRKFLKWFDPRKKQIGTLAFILNRVTAIGLTFYLILHLVMLGKIAQGQEAFDSFIEFAQMPLIKFGEILVIAGGIIHGLNGIRIVFTSFGIGTRYQREFFIIMMILSGLGISIFALKMF